MKCTRVEEHLPHGVCDGHVRLNNGYCVNEVTLDALTELAAIAGHYYAIELNNAYRPVMKKRFEEALEDWNTRKCWEKLNNA